MIYGLKYYLDFCLEHLTGANICNLHLSWGKSNTNESLSTAEQLNLATRYKQTIQ